MSLRLTRRTRIRHQRHFQSIFKRCRRRETPYFRMYVSDCHQDWGCQAFVASKKVGNAVVRNQCKRRMKELLRLTQLDLRLDDVDVIVVAKKALMTVSFSEAQISWRDLCLDLGLMRTTETC